ncbi:MAG: hypothetical protein J0M08_08650 [Bacteroidetes bacterium]|nr:hypothetical protein [Bacteroidota bacterium]
MDTICTSQNLEKIGKKEMVRLNGNLAYSSVFYNASGIENRRQPFTWFLNGSIAANLLDVSLPFTFTYSNNQVAYTQPFNMQSFTPTYKWIKGYAGITAMNFSQYTLAGHVFAGAGIELNPKKIRFSCMYGRLKKAVSFVSEPSNEENLSYKRMGFGATLGYEDNGHALKVIYFSAKDLPTSLSFVPINSTVMPMENTVVSVVGRTTVYKKVTISAEYALSGLTRNINLTEDLSTTPKNRLPFIFTPKSTTQFYDAFKSSIGYSHKLVGLSLNYERVSPNYQTLGAYFFNNDLENITIAPTVSFLEGKLSLSLNTGVQRNNLDRSKLNTTKRWVSSANINYMPTKKLTVFGTVSNFSTYTRQKPMEDPYYTNTLDTLNFYQLSQNAMVNVNYSFGTTKVKQVSSLSVSYQVSSQEQGEAKGNNWLSHNTKSAIPTRFVNTNLSHTSTLIKTRTSITAGLNANYGLSSIGTNLYVGPTVNLAQSFYKNTMRISLGATYNQLLNDTRKINEIFNERISFMFTPKFKKQNSGNVSFSLTAMYLQKLKTTSTALSYNEFTGNMGVNYSF